MPLATTSRLSQDVSTKVKQLFPSVQIEWFARAAPQELWLISVRAFCIVRLAVDVRTHLLELDRFPVSTRLKPRRRAADWWSLMMRRTAAKWSAEHTVALQQVAYQNLDMDCCVVHDGVLFRYCCVTGEQRGRRYIRRWIYERYARAPTSVTETFSGRNIWNASHGALTFRAAWQERGRLGHRCDNDNNGS